MKKQSKAVTYCGKTHAQMNQILSFICDVEDRLELSEEERDDFDIVVQCVTTVMNLMIEENPVVGD